MRNKNIIAVIAILLSVVTFMLSENSRNWQRDIDLEHQIQEQILIGKNLEEQIKNAKDTLFVLEELNSEESKCGD